MLSRPCRARPHAQPPRRRHRASSRCADTHTITQSRKMAGAGHAANSRPIVAGRFWRSGRCRDCYREHRPTKGCASQSAITGTATALSRLAAPEDTMGAHPWAPGDLTIHRALLPVLYRYLYRLATL